MIGDPTRRSVQFGKALPVQVSHDFLPDSAVFDDDNLVSLAGLVPVMALAAQTGLSALLADKVHIAEPRIKSGAVNPAPKLATLIAGMCAGADSIDDVDVVRSGGMKTLFGGVYAPSTIGTLLREFRFGHARQLESVLGVHLGALCGRVDLLPGADVRAFIDIDSLLRRCMDTPNRAPPMGTPRSPASRCCARGSRIGDHHQHRYRRSGDRRDAAAGWADRLGQGRGQDGGPGHRHRRAAGVSGSLLVRGDAAYGTRAVVGACRRARAQFSLVLTKNAAVQKAIEAIEEDAWTPVAYPGAVRDPTPAPGSLTPRSPKPPTPPSLPPPTR